jgi:hypothetical protein
VEKEEQKEGAQFVTFRNNLLWSTSCAKCTADLTYSQGTCAAALQNFLPPLYPLTLASFSSVPLNVTLPWFLELDTLTKSVSMACNCQTLFQTKDR